MFLNVLYVFSSYEKSLMALKCFIDSSGNEDSNIHLTIQNVSHKQQTEFHWEYSMSICAGTKENIRHYLAQ